MPTHPAVAARLALLTPDQRAAATSPPGPILCVAPAGSGKTTTLVARIAWLIDGGTAPSTIAAITFNKRAAEELTQRLDRAIAPLGLQPGAVRVRTFHALGREILRDVGVSVEPLIDRMELFAELWPDPPPGAYARLDTAFSRLKLDLAVDVEQIRADTEAGPTARAFVEYETALADRGALDFDDLVRQALDQLAGNDRLLATWRGRCAQLLVDEVQDVDRSQLRLALLLAAPANRVFLVGDDDQSIYGWRLADVRRVLAIDASLPGLRRMDLEVNHRCPAPVVERALALIGHNRERFAKTIRPRPNAGGTLILASDTADEPERTIRLVRALPGDDLTRAVLARTNRELRPAIVAALALGEPFRAPSVDLLVDDDRLDPMLDWVERATDPRRPLLQRLGALRRSIAIRDEAGRALAGAILAWAPPFTDLAALRSAIDRTRERLAELRQDDARLSLATAHSTKGAEFDHVAIVGMDAGRFPSGRAVAESSEPDRAMEEERRLAYVAWTRARRSLTLSYDPSSPSPFLLEAFTADELGVVDLIA